MLLSEIQLQVEDAYQRGLSSTCSIQVYWHASSYCFTPALVKLK